MNTEDDEFARIAREQALNKKADNARELGLDYEPDIPFGDNNPGLQWDEVPQAFNDWWNADYDPTGNPFGKDTHAYWAWAGWKAAKQPAQQEPVAWKLVPAKPTEEMLKAMDECSKEGYDERLYAGHAASVYMAAVDAAPEQAAQQEPVEFKCIVIDNHHSNGIPFEQWVEPTQRTWVGLTEGEVDDLSREMVKGEKSVNWLSYSIEAKLKEKNQ